VLNAAQHKSVKANIHPVISEISVPIRSANRKVAGSVPSDAVGIFQLSLPLVTPLPPICIAQNLKWPENTRCRRYELMAHPTFEIKLFRELFD
jgi:hypothetical protein